MSGKADLHIHTNHSDGYYSPGHIVKKAKEANLDVISITDHDSLNGIPEAIEAAKEFSIEVIPGVEISSDMGDREVHILAYFVEQNNVELERYLSFFREERIKRAERIVKRLNTLGLSIDISDVMDIAQNCAVGRPHIAQAMLAKNLVTSYYEAFNKYIGNGCPAYEKKVHISPQSAFKIISDAGGLSFIAHPGYMPEFVLKHLIEAGVDGIEVLHPSHSNQQVRFYKGIVNQYFLLESGGSDFHGGKREDEKNMGIYNVTFETLDAMRRRLHRNTA
jgi:3',5'-nucleoside bisphosphate phosphatase